MELDEDFAEGTLSIFAAGFGELSSAPVSLPSKASCVKRPMLC